MGSRVINLNHNKSELIFIGGGRRDYFRLGVSDIEMVEVDALNSYTSLKDILRSSPQSSSSPVISPTKFARKDSLKEEIPIKDPMLQHAAWAYLQPMNSDPDEDDRRRLSKIKDYILGILACFGALLKL